MSEAAERNFHDFHLGDNVYELADGLILEIAERLEVSMSSQPSEQSLGYLVGKIGKNKVLRHNEEVTAIDRETAVELVERSGVQQALDRSLWTPEIPTYAPHAYIATGAVANWQDRTADILQDRTADILIDRKLSRAPVYLVAGSRVMNSVTEQNNPNVQGLTQELEQYPREDQYVEHVIAPRLLEHDIPVKMFRYDTESGEELAANFFTDGENYKLVINGRLAFARVANAGVQLAVQMR